MCGCVWSLRDGDATHTLRAHSTTVRTRALPAHFSTRAHVASLALDPRRYLQDSVNHQKFERILFFRVVLEHIHLEFATLFFPFFRIW